MAELLTDFIQVSNEVGVQVLIYGKHYDVVCLTETWLCGKISDAELFGPEFMVFRRDRYAATLDAPVGGGVLCAVRRDIPCGLVDIAHSQDLELLCIVLMLPHKNVYIATVYIPPCSPNDVYVQLALCIDKLTRDFLPSDEFLLFGDFNLPTVDWESSCEDEALMVPLLSAPQHALHFIDSILSSGLTQSCGIMNDNGKFLDLVFSTDPSGTLVKRCLTPLVPETSHHPALHAVLFFDSVTFTNPVLCDYSFNFKKADFSKINDWLLECDWSVVLDERDIDEAVKSFYDILSLCFVHCVPLSKSNCSQSYQPWVDSSLKHLKNLRNKAWRRFCSSKNDADYFTYSCLRDQFVSALEVSYNNYIGMMKSILHDKPKQFWRFVNSKRKSDGYPSSLKLGDNDSNDPLTIANLFGNFFKTAFLDNNCDINFKDFTHLTRLSPTSLESKDLIFDDAMVLKQISNLADSFSTGPDGIPASFVKRCGSSLVSVLCYLFNLSIHSGVFPESWKLSVIIPLHKNGNKCDISNYRPIAKLCCVSKVFEALVYDVLYFHCKPFLCSFQHGFLKGKSTTTNLLEFSNYCISAIEAGKQVDCIFTDFSKAFDRINHRILVHKLTLLGFPSLFVNWLCSYLSNRTQRVLFRGNLSDIIINTSGVPQGSHLGPLLFNIYINDVCLFLTHSRILCYADDAKIFRIVSNQHDCALLNADLDSFHKWCSINYLPLNISKCTTMSFSRKRTPLHFNFTINGCSLDKLDKTKDLGVWFNTRFSFEDHIDSIVNKANATLGFIKRWSKEFNDPYITKLLYCTFVRPILEYASPVWSPFYAIHINRIEAVQRRFIRFALRGLPWNNPLVLPPYLDRLGLISLETLEKRRYNSMISFAFDCLQGTINSPELLVIFNISAPAHSLRNYGFLQVPHHRTNYGMHEPISSMSRLFNLNFDCIDFHLSKGEVKSQLR